MRRSVLMFQSASMTRPAQPRQGMPRAGGRRALFPGVSFGHHRNPYFLANFQSGRLEPGIGILNELDGGLFAVFFELLVMRDRKSTRLNSSHVEISYAVFCLKKKKKNNKH